MDFILNEAFEESEDFKLVFSDDVDEEFSEEEEQLGSFVTNEEDDMFIDDEEQEEDESFYRNLNNREDYVQFPNQTKNPIEVVEEPEDDYVGEDDMPELFDPENR